MIKDYLCSGMTIDYYVSGSGSKDIALDSLKKIVRPIIISVWSKSTTQTALKSMSKSTCYILYVNLT